MNNAAKICFALLFGLFIAGAPFVASAQEGREAAITRCLKFAQDQHPGDAEGLTAARTAAYKACMTSAGFTP